MNAPSPGRRISSAGVLLGTFAGASLLGTLILRLAVMQTRGDVLILGLPLTSISAICVTGLARVDTAAAWSTAGRAAITIILFRRAAWTS
jgi:trk system potassium uptake protein TrkH